MGVVVVEGGVIYDTFNAWGFVCNVFLCYLLSSVMVAVHGGSYDD